MSVLVVGGGVAGLVAARALAIAGVPVTLVEAGPRLGGKAWTERVDGLVIEHGPDAFVATRPALLDLCRNLELGDRLIAPKEPRGAAIRRGDRLVPIPDGVGMVLPTQAAPFVRTRLFSWPEKLRMARDLVAPRLLPPHDVAVGAWLRARLGDAPVDRLAGPLVGGVYGTPIDELSLDAVVPQLRVAERDHRSLLLAGLAEGRARRRSVASGAAAPFVSLRDGMGSLAEALEASIAAAAAASGTQVAVRTGTGAVALARGATGVTASFVDGSVGRFDGAILATPAPDAARLLREAVPAVATALAGIPHGSTTVVTLAYRRTAAARAPSGHGHLVPALEGGPISACTWSSEKWPGRAPDDVILARAFLRDLAATRNLSDAQRIHLARGEVERTLGITEEPLLARVAAWEASMPRYTVGHLDRVAGIDRALAEWPAITLAGASYRGIGLPDCVASGTAAAARIVERLGMRREAAAATA